MRGEEVAAGEGRDNVFTKTYIYIYTLCCRGGGVSCSDGGGGRGGEIAESKSRNTFEEKHTFETIWT